MWTALQFTKGLHTQNLLQMASKVTKFGSPQIQGLEVFPFTEMQLVFIHALTFTKHLLCARHCDSSMQRSPVPDLE